MSSAAVALRGNGFRTWDQTWRVLAGVWGKPASASSSSQRPGPIRLTLEAPCDEGVLNIVIETNEELPWLRGVLGRIEELLALQSDWDSYGARPVRVNAVTAALLLLVETLSVSSAEVPEIYPTPSGGLQLEWHRPGKFLEVSVEDHDGTLLFEDEARPEKTVHMAAPVTEIRGRLPELIRSLSKG